MSKTSSYLVPSKTIIIEQEIKRSRFIATVGRASDKDAAKMFIEKVRETYPDATHNCYAFIAGNPSSSMDIGFGDDGEVKGTAGKPMLSVLQHKGIGEIASVVSRYFGGTKLGPGGLVRAYTGTLQLAIENLSLAKNVVLKSAEIKIRFRFENTVRKLLKKLNLDIKAVEYGGSLLMKIDVPENIANEFSNNLINRTRGEVEIKWTDLKG